MKAKRHTLALALRTAAKVYEEDALKASELKDGKPLPEGIKRLAAQFDMQAKEANELADAIEAADTVVLED